MGSSDDRDAARRIWELARRQHGVLCRRQLLEAGLSRAAIQHRLRRGRLHPLWRGVYAVGRAEVDHRGRWMGAVLACGPDALLSHRSAAALWGFGEVVPVVVEVVVPGNVAHRRSEIRAHRRAALAEGDRALVQGIPVTSVETTLIDLAAQLADDRLEDATATAMSAGQTDRARLRAALERRRGRPGVGRLRAIAEAGSEAPSSALERRFLALVRRAGLPEPVTQARVGGFTVDFFWPEVGLVVETDGLRFHRTAIRQRRDLDRDHAHAAAGLVTLRFNWDDVHRHPAATVALLRGVLGRRTRRA